MKNCEARITREYKTKKSDCMWPETATGKVKLPEELEVCGGDVTVKLRCVNEPDWGGSYAKMELEWVCTRCKCPWVPGRLALDNAVNYAPDGIDVERLLG